MKISLLKQIVKYKKVQNPIFASGVQMTKKFTSFTDLDSIMLIENECDFIGKSYDIDTNLYMCNANENDEKAKEHEEVLKRFSYGRDFNTKIEVTEQMQAQFKTLLLTMGTDELRPIMSGICITDEHIVSTDAHALKMFKHELELKESFRTVIPANACKFLPYATKIEFLNSKYQDEPEMVAIHGTIDGRKAKLYTKLVDGKFPNYKAIIPEDTQYNGLCLSISKKEMLTLHQLTKRHSNIKISILTIENDELILTNENDEKIKTGLKTLQKPIAKTNALLMPKMLNKDNPKRGFSPELLWNYFRDAQNTEIYFNEFANRAMLINIDIAKPINKTTIKKQVPMTKIVDMKSNDKELIELRAEAKKQNKLIEKLKKENADLTIEIIDLDTETEPSEEMRVLKDEIKFQKEDEKKILAELKEEKAVAKIQNTTSRKLIARLEDTIKDLNLRNVEMEEVIAKGKESNENLKVRIVELLSENELLKNTVASAETKIEAVQNKVAEIEVETVEIKDERPHVKLQPYSEKAFIVFGDTKEIKDDLKSMKCRFNSYLNVDGEQIAGWVCSNKNLDDVTTKLNELTQLEVA